MTYNSRIIEFLLAKVTVQWVFVPLQGCASITWLQDIFLTSRGHGVPVDSHSTFPPLPAPATTNLLSVSKDLPVRDIPYVTGWIVSPQDSHMEALILSTSERNRICP